MFGTSPLTGCPQSRCGQEAASPVGPAGHLLARSNPQPAPQAGQMIGTCPLIAVPLARGKQEAKAPGVIIEEGAAGKAGKGAARAEAEDLGEAAEAAGVRGGALPPRDKDGKGVTLRQAETAGAPQTEAVRAKPEVHPLTVSLLLCRLPFACRDAPREVRAETFLNVTGV